MTLTFVDSRVDVTLLRNGGAVSPSRFRGLGGEQCLTEKPISERSPPSRFGGVPSNAVLIGKKPLMAYATAIVMQANTGNGEIAVKARGRAISKAVDVVEVVRRRFFDGKLDISDILIGTETLGEQGQTRNVSTIEIKLKKRQ
jgi:DNA-binding protein